MGSGVDMATNLGLCADSISDLDCFIFALASVCPVFILFWCFYAIQDLLSQDI